MARRPRLEEGYLKVLRNTHRAAAKIVASSCGGTTSKQIAGWGCSTKAHCSLPTVIMSLRMDIWTILGTTGVAAYLAIRWTRETKRNAKLREMAARRGFTCLGQTPPRLFTLRGTQLGRARSIWNIIDGDCGGIRVISFDCHVGRGKGSWRRTAIAAQGPPDVFGTSNVDLTVERCGEWSLLYEPYRFTPFAPTGLMPVSELESRLDSIRR